MKYYIIAGEASGDLHAANLIREIKLLDPAAIFRAWGGDKVQEQGAELVMHYSHMGFMGFAEVIANLHSILGLLRQCKNDIRKFKPDAVILVDYPGFNFRIARYAKKRGLKVFYYISPQVWAWKRSRVFQVRKWIDRMFVILPFEKDFYRRFNIDVDFVGHPLLDAIADFKKSGNTSLPIAGDQRPIVALLPGSRKLEVAYMLPIMLAITHLFPDFRFVIAGTSSLPRLFYMNIIGSQDVEVVFDKTYALLSHARAALVTSGTATLETALFHIPQVVCYKGSYLSYKIAKQLVKIKYISLVNLIMDRLVVKELIQRGLIPKNFFRELYILLNDANARQKMISDYAELESKLGGPGASARTAKLIGNMLKATK
jgi:lipid-A-disaccharide synthase